MKRNNDWIIPYFYLKAKEVEFPTLSRNKNRDLVEHEKQNRVLEFENNKNEKYSGRRISMLNNDNLKVNINNINNSRPESKFSVGHSSHRSKERGRTPISVNHSEMEEYDEFEKYPTVPKHIETNFGSSPSPVGDRMQK